MNWFDAHLDFSYLALRGRDFTKPLGVPNGGPQPVGLTFPSLRDARVRWVLGTIFVLPSAAPDDPAGYRGGDDAQGAYGSAVRQLEQYHAWEREGRIRLVRSVRDLELGANERGEAKNPAKPQAAPGARGATGTHGRAGAPGATVAPIASSAEPLRVVLLMEGADPIRTPDEAAWWFEQGLRVVGPAWSKGTRYAGGDDSTGDAVKLTPAGRELIKQCDRLGIILDFTHLHDASAEETLTLTKRPVIATHSSSRVVQGNGKQRLISDEMAREIGSRTGVVGIPLYSLFLATDGKRASVPRTIDHLEHLARVCGGKHLTGLGSDMDGGFGADKLPEGIDDPRGYALLDAELARRGWSEQDRAGFARENWLRFFRANLGG